MDYRAHCLRGSTSESPSVDEKYSVPVPWRRLHLKIPCCLREESMHGRKRRYYVRTSARPGGVEAQHDKFVGGLRCESLARLSQGLPKGIHKRSFKSSIMISSSRACIISSLLLRFDPSLQQAYILTSMCFTISSKAAQSLHVQSYWHHS